MTHQKPHRSRARKWTFTQRRLWQRIALIAAAVVVFTTTYALILPGTALEKEGLTCTQEEHTHTDSCYTKTLTCGQQESEGHSHSAQCYDEDGTLTCGQQESAGHTHTDSCYSSELTCGKTEHTHTSSCYAATEEQDTTDADESAETEEETDDETLTDDEDEDTEDTNETTESEDEDEESEEEEKELEEELEDELEDELEEESEEKDDGSDAAAKEFTASASGVSVTASVREDALPEGAYLSVSLLTKSYANDSANDDVSSGAQAAADALDADGADYDDFAALDISFLDADGDEVEPAYTVTEESQGFFGTKTTETTVAASVEVTIELDADFLPAEADTATLAVQHLEESTSSNKESGGSDGSFFSPSHSSSSSSSLSVEDLGGSVTAAKDGSVSVSFEVESFSTFTLTWDEAGEEEVLTAQTEDGRYTIALSDYDNAGIPDDAKLSLDYSEEKTDETAVLELIYGAEELEEIKETIEAAQDEDKDSGNDDTDSGETLSEPSAESVARLVAELEENGEKVSLNDYVTVTLSWSETIELKEDELLVVVGISGTELEVLFEADADDDALAEQEVSFEAEALADYDLMIVSGGDLTSLEDEEEFENTATVTYDGVEYLVTVTNYEDAGDLAGAYVYAYAFEPDEDAVLSALWEEDGYAEGFDSTVFIHAEIRDADGNNMALESDVTAVVTRTDGEPITTLEEGETSYTLEITEETASSSGSDDGVATASEDGNTTTTEEVYTVTNTVTAEEDTTTVPSFEFTIYANSTSTEDDLVTTAPGEDGPDDNSTPPGGDEGDDSENGGGGGNGEGSYELDITKYLSDSLVLWDINDSTGTYNSQDGDNGDASRITSVTLNEINVVFGESTEAVTSGTDGGGWNNGSKLSTYFPNTTDGTYYDGDNDAGNNSTDSSTAEEVSLTITPAAGYYVTSVVIACAPTEGGTDSTTYLTPYNCGTWSAGEETNDTFSDTSGGSATLKVTNLSFAHTSSSGYYFILVTVAPIPSPIYVEYSYGEIVGYLAEDNCDTSAFSTTSWTSASSANVYTYDSETSDGGVQTTNVQFKYTYNDSENSTEDASKWVHYANSVSDDAIAAAWADSYVFVGWEVTYYYSCDETYISESSENGSSNSYEDSGTASDDSDGSFYNYDNTLYTTSSSSGYNTATDSYGYPFNEVYGKTFVQEGEEIKILNHTYIRAIWVKVEENLTGSLQISKTIDSDDLSYMSDSNYHFTFTISTSETTTNSDGNSVSALTGPYSVTITGVSDDSSSSDGDSSSSSTGTHGLTGETEGNSGNTVTGTLTFSGGSATLCLASGESALIEGLPAGVSVTVAETDPSSDEPAYTSTTYTVTTVSNSTDSTDSESSDGSTDSGSGNGTSTSSVDSSGVKTADNSSGDGSTDSNSSGDGSTDGDSSDDYSSTSGTGLSVSTTIPTATIPSSAITTTYEAVYGDDEETITDYEYSYSVDWSKVVTSTRCVAFKNNFFQFYIVKVDEDGNLITSSEATFTLTTSSTDTDGSTTVTYYNKNGNVVDGPSDSDDSGDSGDSNGSDDSGNSDNTDGSETYKLSTSSGILVFSGLADGTYTLTEIEAPDGYNLLTNVVYLTVSNGGVTVSGNTSAKVIESFAYTDSSGNSKTLTGYIVKVTNTTGEELPSTGGIGTGLPRTLGALLSITAAAFLWGTFQRRKRERRAG